VGLGRELSLEKFLELDLPFIGGRPFAGFDPNFAALDGLTACCCKRLKPPENVECSLHVART
jgi:hypothetical protein